MDLLTDIEIWLVNNTEHPFAAAFIVGLILATWIIPDVWKVVRARILVARMSSAKTEWEQDWHKLEDARREFWRLIKTGYGNWGQRPDDRSLLDFIEASRFPSELPLSDGQQFPKWVWSAPKEWEQKAKLLDQFAAQIYLGVVPAKAVKTQLMGGTNEFDKFDDLRRDLSKFWDCWGRQEPLEQVIREQKADSLVKSSSSEIKLLTFLEIARARWAQTGASGKAGLFELGKRNTETGSDDGTRQIPKP